MTRNLDQTRAANALDVVAKLRQGSGDRQDRSEWNDRYASYVESLPATILTCGLGQACAMLLAAARGDAKDPHLALYRHLQDWLCRNESGAVYPAGDLLEAVVNGDRYLYLRAQAEALAWLQWLKKLAVAYLKRPKRTGGDAGDSAALQG